MLKSDKIQMRLVHSGFSMIEVLVTIVVVAIGLLGLSGLQARTMVMEMESYQRGQALLLLQDLEDRIKSARGDLSGPIAPVASGATTVVIGQGATTYNNPDVTATLPCGSYSGNQLRVCEWALMLKGASEKVSTSGVGAMLGAQACIVSVAPTQLNALAEFYLVVVWQGLAATSDPTSAYITNCASNTNFGAGMRRGVVTRVLVPKLSA